MDFDYAARQIAAVWSMAWNRPRWADSLDRSVDGVFRSFWAMAFAAPFALLGVISLRRAATRIPDFPSTPFLEYPLAFTIGFQAIGFVADWAVSLAALVFAARALGASRRIADIIVGFNWLQVIVAFLQAAPLAALGIAGGRQVAGVLLLPATAIVLTLYWGMIRRSLQTNVVATIGLIIILTMLGLMTNSIIGAVAGVILQAFS